MWFSIVLVKVGDICVWHTMCVCVCVLMEGLFTDHSGGGYKPRYYYYCDYGDYYPICQFEALSFDLTVQFCVCDTP